MEADRKLPAIKIFISQLSGARKSVQSSGVMSEDDNGISSISSSSSSSQVVGLTLLGVEFTRVWLQGVVVKVYQDEGSFVVDDGTGTVTAVVPGIDLDRNPNTAGGGAAENWNGDGSAEGLPDRGQHVLLVGAVEVPPDGWQRNRRQQPSSCSRYRVLCDVLKNVGPESPNRETLWWLEVVDFWRSRLQSHSS